MTIDERVGRILSEMSGDLTPDPSPYARVLARYRRRQRQRIAVAGLATVAVVAGAGFAVTGPGRGGDPDTSASSSGQSWQNELAWSERLAASPPRGAVARDAGYVAAVSQRMLQEQRAGQLKWKTPMTAANVLFVDDVGSFRIALVAFVRADPEPNGWPHREVWLVAPKGASAKTLASTASIRDMGDGLAPYEDTTVDKPGEVVHVSVAPQGCEFSSAAWPAVNDWKAEATGSYLIRTKLRPEWWRVTCNGVVREMRPSPGSVASTGITDALFDQAMSHVRGEVDAKQSRTDLGFATADWGYGVTALPHVVWNGRTAGTTPADGIAYDGQATVLAAPAVGGGWVGEVTIHYDRRNENNSNAAGESFTTPTDPTDPSTVVAIELGTNTNTLLVITPSTATTIRALKGGREVANARVSAAGAVLKVPSITDLTVQALDAQGNVVGTGKVAAQGPGSAERQDHWSED
jgi:hypothetical protein